MLNGGIGLRNVSERLRLLYGDEATFSIVSQVDQGFNVELAFPLDFKENGK